MFRKKVLIASLAVLAGPVFAQDDAIDRSGIYESEGDGQSLRVDLTHLSGDRYSAAISSTVPITDGVPGCGGGVAGELSIDGTDAMLSVPNEGFVEKEKETLQNSRFCKVSLTFLDEYTLELEEDSGCSYYHGASCSFTGTVVHEASGI